MENNKNNDMGLGELANPNLIFVRQFRFLISSEHLSDSYNFAVHINWTEKVLTLDAYEVIVGGSVPIHNWADAMERGDYPDESLGFVTLDGCGNELYRYKFSDLKITGRENYFIYEKSDVSMHKVTLSFGKSEKMSVTSDPHKIMKDMTLAEVNHLNAKGWTAK